MRNRSFLVGLFLLAAPALALVAFGVRAHAQSVKVFTVVPQPGGNLAYLVNDVANATITLAQGQTYTFNVAATGHPFFIKTARGTASANFSTGVTNNGIDSGTVTFAVPTGTAGPLFYQCGIHNPMGGTIIITAPIPAVPPVALIVFGGLILAVGLAALRRRQHVPRPA